MSEEKDNGNVILYQTSDGQSKIEVTLSDDTVWLTADQMAGLFQRNKLKYNVLKLCFSINA